MNNLAVSGNVWTMDIQHFHDVVRYCLVVAAQSDDFAFRSLGPIHLIKYAYLADLDYAKYNNGGVFTGVEWVFHNFGPWSAEAFTQIEPALESFGAEKRVFQSQFDEKDCVRWKLPEGTETDLFERSLPVEIKHAIGNYFRRFGNDTAALLHFVYSTPPMLNAAPEERLDFTAVVPSPRPPVSQHTPYLKRITSKQRKRLFSGMEELRARFQSSFAQESASLSKPIPEQHDHIYIELMEWLEGLAGNEFPEQGATVVFSDEIWKSPARRGDA